MTTAKIVMWAAFLVFGVELLRALYQWRRGGGAKDANLALLGMLGPPAYLLKGTVRDSTIVLFLLLVGGACLFWRSRLTRESPNDPGDRAGSSSGGLDGKHAGSRRGVWLMLLGMDVVAAAVVFAALGNPVTAIGAAVILHLATAITLSRSPAIR